MLHHELMLTLLAYTMQTVHADWTQRGSDFLGESTSYAGGSVSISSDGLISAVGAPWGSGFAGTVRVYEFSAGAWNQLGSDIVGEASNDQSGISVSLSSDGSRVAIGAWENHVGAEDNAGHVRVYSYAASEWSQLGSDIDGEAAYDNFGISVSLNSDGSRVAIGAHGNDGTASGAGRVRMYSYAASAWGQLGGDMDGAAEDDGFGYSVSLNSDGTRVAIGGEACSYVRVYEFSGITWGQLGVNIDGTAADDFGWSVSISSDGTRVAIGAPENDEGGTNAGKVQVFEYAASSWSQMGNNILGTNSGSNSKGIGYSVSISSDGSRVAIGAPYFSPTVEGTEHSSAGMVRVVDYSGSDWSPLGSDIYGESVGSNQDNAGWSVALSADGRSVAVGSRGFNFYSGRARIYHDPGLTSAMGDPHITFAHGGSADFRGSHRTFYAFLTSPGFQFAPYFQEVQTLIEPHTP